ncbi:hypothetical protein PRN20_02790 [Devosia sp. ZB163]|nr:hypothetical protein [Devosia sp. ZB163]MDC9822650.1 hypothetical protein [Devosia sp. ZB163]
MMIRLRDQDCETALGNKMAFPGIKDPTELADLVAYLAIQTIDR